MGREVWEQDALGRRTTVGYDVRGARTLRVDGRGWPTSYAYDALGRLTESLYPAGNRTTLAYDAEGRLASATDASGQWLRTYDAAGRLRTEVAPSHPDGQPLTNVFDAAGNRLALQTWFGALTAGFDPWGSFATFQDPEGGRATWQYDALGRPVEQRNPDGSRTTTAYDLAGRLVGTRHTDQIGAELDLALLAYDAAGNPVLKVTRDGAHPMSYDALNQLLSELHPVGGAKTWSYDPAGNRLSQDRSRNGVRTQSAWTYDAADQLATEVTAGQPTAFLFDGAGNQRVVSGPDGTTTYTWDADNRLLQLGLPSGAVQTMAYRWDGLRHRLYDEEGDKRMVWDQLGSSGYVDLLQERLP